MAETENEFVVEKLQLLGCRKDTDLGLDELVDKKECSERVLVLTNHSVSKNRASID